MRRVKTRDFTVVDFSYHQLWWIKSLHFWILFDRSIMAKRALTCQIIVHQILLFFGKKNLRNLIRTYIFINVWDFSIKTWFSPIWVRKNPSYTALLRPTYLLFTEKSATYTIKWSCTIIWQVRVVELMNLDWWVKCNIQFGTFFVEKKFQNS